MLLNDLLISSVLLLYWLKLLHKTYLFHPVFVTKSQCSTIMLLEDKILSNFSICFSVTVFRLLTNNTWNVCEEFVIYFLGELEISEEIFDWSWMSDDERLMKNNLVELSTNRFFLKCDLKENLRALSILGKRSCFGDFMEKH